MKCKILILILIVCLCGCSKRVSEPVERIVMQTDTVWQWREIRRADTVRLRDSRFIFSYDSIAPVVDSTGRVTGYDRHHYRYVGGERDADVRRSLAVSDTLRRHQMSADKRVEVRREKSSAGIWWWIVIAAFIAGFIIRRR